MTILLDIKEHMKKEHKQQGEQGMLDHSKISRNILWPGDTIFSSSDTSDPNPTHLDISPKAQSAFFNVIKQLVNLYLRNLWDF